MLAPRLLRRLALDPRDHPRGQPHLSSASGLVIVQGKAYMVADDEHHLAQLDSLEAPLRLVRFAPGELPADAKARKRAKPDLEVLLHFPGRLVALGSASRPQRERAFVFELDEQGELAGAPATKDLDELCETLRGHFAELNLEGGFCAGGEVHLFQRGNKGKGRNARITYPADPLRAWLTGHEAHPPAPREVALLDLGDIGGVPLGITDAAAWPGGGWVFTAVAEDTGNAYDDAACVGSIIGWADEAHRIARREPLQGSPKVEGIAVPAPGCLWLVTDADDPARASELLEVRLPSTGSGRASADSSQPPSIETADPGSPVHRRP